MLHERRMRQRLLDLCVKRAAELRRIRQRLYERRLVNDDMVSHIRCADGELQRNDGAAARSEHNSCRSTDMPQQRSRIFGLLIERARPVGRLRELPRRS